MWSSSNSSTSSASSFSRPSTAASNYAEAATEGLKTKNIGENSGAGGEGENMLTISKKETTRGKKEEDQDEKISIDDDIETTLASKLDQLSAMLSKTYVVNNIEGSSESYGDKELKSIPNIKNNAAKPKNGPTSVHANKFVNSSNTKSYNKTNSVVNKSKKTINNTAPPDDIQILLSKNQNNFHKDTIAPTLQYTQSTLIGYVQKRSAMGSLGNIPDTIPLRDRQLLDIANKRSKINVNSIKTNEEIVKCLQVPKDDDEIVNRLNNIRGIFGRGKAPTLESFENESKKLTEKVNRSIDSSKKTCMELLDSWKSNLESQVKKVRDNNQNMKESRFEKSLKLNPKNFISENNKPSRIDTFITATKEDDQYFGGFILDRKNFTPSKPRAEPSSSKLTNNFRNNRNNKKDQEKISKKLKIMLYIQHKWFISLLVNFMNYKKKHKSKIKVPPACYIFLGALQRIIDLEVPFNQESMYALIEKTIPSELHRSNIVYSMLQPALDNFGVNEIAFMNYLKLKAIVPSAKHLQIVKKITKKQARMAKSLRKKKLRRAPSYRQSSALLPSLREYDENRAYENENENHKEVAEVFPIDQQNKDMIIPQQKTKSYLNLNDLMSSQKLSDFDQYNNPHTKTRNSIRSEVSSDFGEEASLVYGSDSEYDDTYSDFGDNLTDFGDF